MTDSIPSIKPGAPPLGINYASPLSRALAYAVFFSNGNYTEYVNMTQPFFSPATYPGTFSPSIYGTYFNNSTKVLFYGVGGGYVTPLNPGTGGVTIFSWNGCSNGGGVKTMVCSGTNNSANSLYLAGNCNTAIGSATGLLAFTVGSSASTVVAGVNSIAGVVDGNIHQYVGRRDYAGNLTVWSDGVNVTTGSGSTSTAISNPSGTNLFLGGTYGSGGNLGTGCPNQVLQMGWNRDLSNNEIVQLTLNPYQVFDFGDISFLHSSGSGGGKGLHHLLGAIRLGLGV